ncbi:MAG: hypothetical protein ABR520_02510 [Mycobacteriales bacterium]|nr:hypothetical protein [Frankia sp.]
MRWSRKPRPDVSRRLLGEYGNTLARGGSLPGPGVDLSWVNSLSSTDRVRFLGELRESLEECERAGEASCIERVINRWRITSQSLDTRELRQALLSPDDQT